MTYDVHIRTKAYVVIATSLHSVSQNLVMWFKNINAEMHENQYQQLVQ